MPFPDQTALHLPFESNKLINNIQLDELNKYSNRNYSTFHMITTQKTGQLNAIF